jgi:dihydrofolate reductase
MSADEELHRHAAKNIAQADALLLGRVTYEMMEAAWRPPAQTVARPDWMEPFARTIDAAKKYVVSSTLKRVDWNAELVRGDLGTAVQELKRESGTGLFVGGVTLPMALAELGLIDEYEFMVQPRIAGHGPTLFAGLTKRVDLKLVSREHPRRCTPQSETMANTDSRVTIHMAASLDGFIARKDGSVDWMETPDRFEGGEVMAPEFVAAFLRTIDCYVMGSRTYETALNFEANGMGWSYGDKPIVVLTHRELRKTRSTVEFYAGDLERLVEERLKPNFRSIWFVGGGAVSGECLRRGLADEVRYSILPVVIGDGIPFFESLGRDVALHLLEVKAYQSGVVALRYEVKRPVASGHGLRT